MGGAFYTSPTTRKGSSRMDKKQKEALKEVNRIRKREGLIRLSQLQKGERYSLTQCPIARSLPGSTISRGRIIWKNKEEDTPFSIGRFINLFDNGFYPMLELKRRTKEGDRPC
jgi:hypothetical protein